MDVVTGVCEKEISERLRAYQHHRRTGRPLCVLKAALSLDGMIGCNDGTSQWITSAAARRDVHMLRARSQAVMVGSGTACADKPTLTARDTPMKHVGRQLRVVLDARGRVSEGPLLDTREHGTLIFTREGVDPAALQTWKDRGCEVLFDDTTGAQHGSISPSFVLDQLGRRGVLQLLVEGGCDVHTSFLKACAVDELVLYRGNCIIGAGGRPWFGSALADTMADVKRWRLVPPVECFENDVKTVYTPSP